MSSGAITYLRELKNRKRDLQEAIKLLEKQTAMPQRVTPEFMEKYRLLNLKRIDLKTVKSRIENYGKPRPGIEEHKLITIKE